MAEHGYVKWWRCGMLNALWNEKPFDSWHAWDYLMARASFQDNRVYFQKHSFNLRRGQLVTTYRQLARDWGWSNHKVKRFLNSLASPKTFTFFVPEVVPPDDPQLIISPVGGCILVTLCNYAAYQDAKNEEDLRNLLKKRRASRKSSHPSSLERPTDVPASSHRRPTREEGKERQQQQEREERTSNTSPTSVAAAPGADGGTAVGDAVAVTAGGVQASEAAEAGGEVLRDPILEHVSGRRGAELLEEIGVESAVAASLALQRPVGEILDICLDARRGKLKPAGHARRAIERGWKAPRGQGEDFDRLVALLRADADALNSRFRRLAGGDLLLKRHIPRLEGEGDDEYLRRVQTLARGGSAAKGAAR